MFPKELADWGPLEGTRRLMSVLLAIIVEARARSGR
jgi:hypothetical protein